LEDPVTPVPYKVAFVTLARGTYDIAFAREIRRRSVAALCAVEGVNLVTPDDVLVEPEDARKLGAEFASQQVALLIIQNGTFALGDLAVHLAQSVQAPILLWAVTEPPCPGGTLRSNSLVGANVNASNLFKLGFRPRFAYGLPEDDDILAELARSCRVAGAVQALRHTRIGLIGGHAIGFYNLAVNELQLRQRFGVEIQLVGLQEAFSAAQSLPTVEAERARQQLESYYPIREEVSDAGLDKMARQFGGLRAMASASGLDALAVRCWPEWAAQYGIAACGSVSALNTEGLITGCEGDVDGTVTMLLGSLMTGGVPFLADFISAEAGDNTGTFWHGGCAARQLAANASQCTLNSHFAGGKGITAGFTCRAGRITIARLSHDGTQYRLLLLGAEALPTDQEIKGVLMKVRFDAPVPALLRMLMESGVEHHYCILHGDWQAEFRAFAHWTNLTILSS
jgi:L-fucose isomerase-like protein